LRAILLMHQLESSTVSEAARSLSLSIVPTRENSVSPTWWWFEVFGIKVYCYNFSWRRQAIAHHDLHHILTGCPLTLLGEMQVATWEYAAGRYRNVFANLFCLPLVALGCIVAPNAVWSAFRHGRRSLSLFATPITPDLLGLRVEELQARFTNRRPAQPVWLDLALFAGLVGLSALSIVGPIGIAWLLVTSL